MMKQKGKLSSLVVNNEKEEKLGQGFCFPIYSSNCKYIAEVTNLIG